MQPRRRLGCVLCCCSWSPRCSCCRRGPFSAGTARASGTPDAAAVMMLTRQSMGSAGRGDPTWARPTTRESRPRHQMKHGRLGQLRNQLKLRRCPPSPRRPSQFERATPTWIRKGENFKETDTRGALHTGKVPVRVVGTSHSAPLTAPAAPRHGALRTVPFCGGTSPPPARIAGDPQTAAECWRYSVFTWS